MVDEKLQKMQLYLMYSSLFSSVTWMFPPSGLSSWVVTSPRISLSTEKNISRPHSSMLLSLQAKESLSLETQLTILESNWRAHTSTRLHTLIWSLLISNRKWKALHHDAYSQRELWLRALHRDESWKYLTELDSWPLIYGPLHLPTCCCIMKFCTITLHLYVHLSSKILKKNSVSFKHFMYRTGWWCNLTICRFTPVHPIMQTLPTVNILCTCPSATHPPSHT